MIAGNMTGCPAGNSSPEGEGAGARLDATRLESHCAILVVIGMSAKGPDTMQETR